MTWRRPVLALAAAAATVTAMLTGAGPAAAGTTFRSAIGCDSTTDTITAGVSGGSLTPGLRVNVEFLVQSGSFVTAATQGSIPQRGQTVTVPAVAAADGSVSATGYSRAWPSGSYLFYTETVSATVRNTAGAFLMSSSATCFRDVRTTVTLSCDPQAHTITAATAGTGYTRTYLGSVRVEYTTVTTRQATRDSLRWRGYNTMPPDFSYNARVTAGAWSDAGYVHNVTGDPYYLDEALTVLVRDNGLLVGRGEAGCVYADQSGS